MSNFDFNPELHTAAARQEQLENFILGHENILIVGSVGRAAVLGESVSFQKGKLGRGARDIDFVNLDAAHPVILTQAEKHPYMIDQIAEGLIEMQPGKSYSTVYFDTHRRDISVELSNEVFAPYNAEFEGVKINTAHPDTLKRVGMFYQANRAKDKISAARFQKRLEQDLDYSKLPDELFEPLEELRAMAEKDPYLRLQIAAEKLRARYIDTVPEILRRGLDPALGWFKRRLGLYNHASSGYRPLNYPEFYTSPKPPGRFLRSMREASSL